LAPRLHGNGDWRFSHFRIGIEYNKNPFLALARALVPLFVNGAVVQLSESEALAGKLERREVSLGNVIGVCRKSNPGKHVLIIFDQCEELFTLVPDEPVRRSFIDTILQLCNAPFDQSDFRFSLILALRADYFGRALEHRRLADALQDGVEMLGPMTADELTEAIVRPAELVGVSFDEGLVDTLHEELLSRPSQLAFASVRLARNVEATKRTMHYA
jgi:hypothetical protein